MKPELKVVFTVTIIYVYAYIYHLSITFIPLATFGVVLIYPFLSRAVICPETALQYNTPAGLRKDSEIHHVVVYGKLSKTCQRLKKGVRACIEGRIKPSTNEIIADRIEWERMVGQEI